jgi:hypothetical protein
MNVSSRSRIACTMIIQRAETRGIDLMPGHRPFRKLTERLPPVRKARIADKAAALETALALHELRKARAVSQEALADRLAVGQPAVAKLERRPDMYVSNLRRYVEALGGDAHDYRAISGGCGNDCRRGRSR